MLTKQSIYVCSFGEGFKISAPKLCVKLDKLKRLKRYLCEKDVVSVLYNYSVII